MITSAVPPTPPEAGPGRPGRPRPILAVERDGPDPRGGRVRCLVTWPGGLPLLADVVPVFEQLGVRVADHYPLDRDRR